jgi:hypothetical protein
VVPTPPAWLTDLEARRYWGDLAPILTVNKLLTAGNLGLLAQLCALHGKLVAIGSNREMQPNAALLSQFKAYHGALGLLGWSSPGAKGPANRFEKHARPVGRQTRENH